MKTLTVLVLGLSVCMAIAVEAAKIKTRAEPDPTFDFSTLRTYAWDAEGGDVMMARTATDDPAALKQRVDPLVRKYVDAELTKRKLTVATGAAPDVQLHYYVLVTIGDNSQFMGQFLPAVPYWGLPPFNASTTALNVVTKGSLVLDALLPGTAGNRKVVWRGIAESTVEDTDSDQVRNERIQTAAAELIKRLPSSKPKK
jgi:hypothetical protein